MFCRNCAEQLDDKAVLCIKCATDPRVGTSFCQHCGKPTAAQAIVCVSCGVPLTQPAKGTANNKVAAGICGILLGTLGVHKFILGYTKEGLIMLAVTILTCGWGAIPMYIIGIIEGIIYLTKSDEEFVRTYVDNKKGWF